MIVPVISLLLTLAPGGSVERSAQVVVTLPDWVSSPVCRVLDDEDRVVAEQTGHRLTIPCGAPAGTLACDAANGEPVDLPIATLCRAPELTLERGRSVELQLAHQGPLTAEWLQVGPGATLRTLATRSLTGPNPSIVLASYPGRLIRLRVAGSAPVTVRPAPLVRSAVWGVPPLREGGELIAIAERAHVRPERYRVRGAHSLDPEATDDGVLLATGLRPGRYDLTPVYEGGVAGRPVPFQIDIAESTVVPLASERLGQADITLDAAVCAETLEVRIDRLRDGAASPDGIRSSRSRVVSFPHLGRCTHRVAGLPAGRYEARVGGGPSRLTVPTEFSIEEDTTTPVLVEASIVRLSGRVLLNGQPFSTPVSLVFHAPSEPGRLGLVLATAPVEPDGTYSVSFAEPGRYRARVAASNVVLLGHERTLELLEPHTVVDWDLEGGTLIVEIENWDRASNVEVQLRRTSPAEREVGNTWISVGQSDEVPIRVEGLGYDAYVVDGRQAHPDGDTRVAYPETVTLSAGRTSATVRLRLDANERVITVRDEFGAVIEGAEIAIGGNRTVPPLDPGVFRLTGNHLTMGSTFAVRATGFTSTCRQVAGGSRLDVVLERGVPVAVDFLTDQALPDTPGRIVWPGAECAVSLRSFERKLIARGKGRMTYLFPHFPSAPVLNFFASAFEGPVDAQAVRVVDGRLQVKLPFYPYPGK